MVQVIVWLTVALCRRTNLVQALQGAKAQRQTLGPASYSDKTGDGSILSLLLDAQVGKGILT